MSTAGKFLSILVALMLLVSIYLLSMVSQLNRNWGRGIESVSDRLEQTAEQVREARANAYRIERQVLADRQSNEAITRSLRIQIERLDDRLSALKEDQLRLELRSQDEQGLIARLEDAIAAREQEKANLQASLDEENARRDLLAAENAERIERLLSLREQLTTLLAENQSLLRQVADRGQAPSDFENTD